VAEKSIDRFITHVLMHLYQIQMIFSTYVFMFQVEYVMANSGLKATEAKHSKQTGFT